MTMGTERSRRNPDRNQGILTGVAQASGRPDASRRRQAGRLICLVKMPWQGMTPPLYPVELTPAEAESLILDSIPLFHQEDCPIARAHGRVLRAPILADRDLPPFDRVTMDGYALRSAAVAAGVRRFRVESVQAAGMRPGTLGTADDACIEIMTGAVLPAGADGVVPYEDTERDGGAMSLLAGRDGQAGAVGAPRRAAITRAANLSCRRAPPSPDGRSRWPRPAAGPCSRSANCRRSRWWRRATSWSKWRGRWPPTRSAGAMTTPCVRPWPPRAIRHVERFHLRDIRHEIEHMLWHLLAEYDVLLLTGGVSKGKFDYLPSELERQGVRKIFHGVAQRPGKPFWFGLSGRLTPVFALPGNPVSAYTCLHRYVLPALAKASGQPPAAPRRVALAAPFTFRPKLACLLPVTLSSGPRAELLATPAAGNTSGDFAGLVGTDGFVELPPGPIELAAGFIAPVLEMDLND